MNKSIVDVRCIEVVSESHIAKGSPVVECVCVCGPFDNSYKKGRSYIHWNFNGDLFIIS